MKAELRNAKAEKRWRRKMTTAPCEMGRGKSGGGKCVAGGGRARCLTRMKIWCAVVFFGWAAVAGAGAQVDTFTQALRADDFAAAGLGKLSAEELARLNGLVRDYKNGALAEAKREVAVAVVTSAASAEPAKKAEGGLLAKAKVLLTPGTEVEYATVESRIAGDFVGWEGRAVLKLENGQRWQIANGGFYSTPPIPNPKVKIVPASLGGFWMTIEGVASRVRVQPFGAK